MGSCQIPSKFKVISIVNYFSIICWFLWGVMYWCLLIVHLLSVANVCFSPIWTASNLTIFFDLVHGSIALEVPILCLPCELTGNLSKNHLITSWAGRSKWKGASGSLFMIWQCSSFISGKEYWHIFWLAVHKYRLNLIKKEKYYLN